MSKTRLLLQLLSLFFLLGCEKAHDCQIDPVLENFIEAKFARVNRLDPPTSIGGHFFVDIFFLEALTELESSVAFGEISIYETRTDIRRDLK